MKTHLVIIFFLMTAFCYADPPAGKTGTITVAYTGSDGKSFDVTAAGLSIPDNGYVALPLYISDARHWTAHVDVQYDKSNQLTNQFEFSIFDIKTLNPPHGDFVASSEEIFHGFIDFENGKPVTVLRTTSYSITVTVTLPAEKK